MKHTCIHLCYSSVLFTHFVFVFNKSFRCSYPAWTNRTLQYLSKHSIVHDENIFVGGDNTLFYILYIYSFCWLYVLTLSDQWQLSTLNSTLWSQYMTSASRFPHFPVYEWHASPSRWGKLIMEAVNREPVASMKNKTPLWFFYSFIYFCILVTFICQHLGVTYYAMI